MNWLESVILQLKSIGIAIGKIAALLGLVAILLTVSSGTALASPPIDIVFDIDWTTFYSINTGEVNQLDGKAISIEGKTYRATDHLGEVLEKLASHPDVRISFFSGGERSRNEALLKAYTLPSGRTAFDIAFKVLSKEQLTIKSNDTTLKFTDRYKKDVTNLIPGANPNRTILIDDQIEFAVKPWKAVDSLGHINFQKTYDSTKAGSPYYPLNAESWHAERDKALMWQALITEALEKTTTSSKSFSNIVTKLWEHKSMNALCKNVFSM